MHHDVGNVEAVIVRDGRYLMTFRSTEESHAPGALRILGGKLEAVGIVGNILDQTLRREIREEVGIEVNDVMAYLESKAFVRTRSIGSRRSVVDGGTIRKRTDLEVAKPSGMSQRASRIA